MIDMPDAAARRPLRDRRRRLTAAIVGLALATLHAALCLPAVLNDEQTFDEPIHMLAGYAILTENRHDIDRLHPPLSRMILALPLVPLGPRTPPDPLYQHRVPALDFNTTAYSVDFLYKYNPDLTRSMLLTSRLAVVLFSSLTVLLVFASLYNLTDLFISGTVGLLYATDPNVLAHGHLATTDTITSFFYLLSALFVIAYLASPSARLAGGVGIATGLTMSAKVTGLLIWPSLVICLIIHSVFRFFEDHSGSLSRLSRNFLAHIRACWRQWALILATSLLTLWCVYRLELKSLPLDAPLMQATAARINQNPSLRILREARLPFIDYSRTLLAGVIDNTKGRPAFLAGELYHGGNPLFFPVAFIVKSTPTFLILLFASLVMLPYHRVKRKSLQPWVASSILVCLVYAAVIIVFASRSSVNIGIRHVLPAISLLYLFIGVSLWVMFTNLGERWRAISRSVLVVFVVLGCASTALVMPRYLTYFNFLAGGPGNGYRWFVDSNLDWGQGIGELVSYLASRRTGPVYVEYSGTAPVESYGIDALPLRKATRDVPASCTIAISATSLQMSADPAVAAFRDFPPDDLVANSILIYRQPDACARLALLRPGEQIEWTGW